MVFPHIVAVAADDDKAVRLSTRLVLRCRAVRGPVIFATKRKDIAERRCLHPQEGRIVRHLPRNCEFPASCPINKDCCYASRGDDSPDAKNG